MLANALEIQEKLNALQQELHEALLSNDEKLKQAQAKIFDEREKMIQQWSKSECHSSPHSSSDGSSLPMNFWAKAIISALELYDKESEENIHFLGPYDAELLTKYLVSMKVEFLPHSQKVILNFKENPFFEETVLWAELHYPLEETVPEKKVKHNSRETNDSQSEEEEEKDEEDEEHWTFSGVTWKPGYGPQDEEEDEEEEDAEKQEKSGSKRKRDESSEKPSTTKETSVVGPSMLAVFSTMPPHPSSDPEFLEKLEEEYKEEDMDEEDAEAAMEEELAEAVDSWEGEMNHREQLLSLLIEDIYTNPVEAILVDKADVIEEPPAQKSKSE